MNLVTGSALVDLAFPLMPSNPDRHGMVAEAGEAWSFDAATIPPEAECVVWGRLCDRSPPPEAARRAIDRERALRRLSRRLPPGWRVAGVHPVPPRYLRTPGLRTRAASALHAGALVELTTLPGGHRVLDAVAAAAGAIAPGRIHFGAGGTLVAGTTLADGSAAVLRVGRSGTTGDPAPVVATLERLAAAGVAHVPILLARGHTLGTSWLAESTLPGHRPRRLTPALALLVAETCARFPTAGGPPTALADDLAGIAGHLPGRAGRLSRLAAVLEPGVRAWPGVLRHGDLWTGNLLVERGRLSALLDWDAAHPAAVPGADLVHLFGAEALSRHRTLGATFLARPWRSDRFRRASAPYWAALALVPGTDLLDLAGVAWWAAAVHGTLTRFPVRRCDERWLAVNVDAVLDEIC